MPAFTPSSATSLAGFWRLPNELQLRILGLACQAPELEDSAASRSPLDLDVPTTLSIMLSTRRLYPHTASLLYRNIKITTVSALQLLQRTLSERPALGRLVKSLHMGPTDDLPKDWWPIHCNCYDFVGASIETSGHELMTSLSYEDEARMPGWCYPKDCWDPRDYGENADCHHRAIWKAVPTALKSFDVDIYTPHCDSKGNRIGRDCWATRIWEAQAVVDLYLLRMRQTEDENNYPALNWREHSTWHDPRCSGKDCHPYLKLVLTATPRPETRDNFFVSMPELRQHLARRGSKTDRLDSPLHLARSGLLMFDYHRRDPAITTRDAPYVVEGKHSPGLDDNQPDDDADLFAVTEGEGYARAPHAATFGTAIDPSLPATPTLGSLLATARSILSFTSALRNFSTTDFMERLICGTRSPADLKALRAVSVGPPPPQWSLPLHFGNSAFNTVEKLRICAAALTQDDVDALVGHCGQLPALKELQYSSASTEHHQRDDLAEKGKLSPANAMLHLIIGLSGVREAVDAARRLEGEAGHKKRRREDYAQDEGGHIYIFPVSRCDTKRAQPLFIEARLHPREVKKLLAKAPTPAVRSAWIEGTIIPGHFSEHRLRVIELPASAVELVDKESDFEPPKVPQELFAEGQKWWAECARGVGRR